MPSAAAAVVAVGAEYHYPKLEVIGNSAAADAVVVEELTSFVDSDVTSASEAYYSELLMMVVALESAVAV